MPGAPTSLHILQVEEGAAPLLFLLGPQRKTALASHHAFPPTTQALDNKMVFWWNGAFAGPQNSARQK